MVYFSYYLNNFFVFSFVASKEKNVETSPVQQTVYSVQVSYTIEWWGVWNLKPSFLGFVRDYIKYQIPTINYKFANVNVVRIEKFKGLEFLELHLGNWKTSHAGIFPKVKICHKLK